MGTRSDNQSTRRLDRSRFRSPAKRIADQQFGEAIEEFRKLTDFSPTQVGRVREWLCENGAELENLRGETIEQTLKIELPPEARRVLEIRSMVASTSLKKLDAILACVGPDGRARGLLQYHGATTGPWSGQLIQPQNFPRPTLTVVPDPEAIGAGDFSMIECCVLLALAGQRDKCELIARGVDVYRDMAAQIYGLYLDAFL